jgi:hypothetical protein
MQLQYLCSFKFDEDIKTSLGRLPPDLQTLYGNIYDVLSKTPGKRASLVFFNVLRWLLCAQKSLLIEAFLGVGSIDRNNNTSSDPITKEHVLEICNNFVVYDGKLRRFRFAHLSVREFLETRLSISTANKLMAELCLWSVLSEEDNAVTIDLLHQLELRASPVLSPSVIRRHSALRPWTPSEILYAYAVANWATHCKLAGDDRESGALKLLLRHMISYEPSFVQWNVQLLASLDYDFGDFKVMRGLRDTIAFDKTQIGACIESREDGQDTLRRNLRSPNALRMSMLAVCCVFNLGEQVESVLGDHMLGRLGPSERQKSLQLAEKYGSSATIQQLLMTTHWTKTDISSEVIETAARNSDNAKAPVQSKRLKQAITPTANELTVSLVEHCQEDVIASLSDQRGADAPITEEVVRAALCRPEKEARRTLEVLLERRERKVCEVLARDQKYFGVLHAGKVRVKCGNSWVYLRRDKTSGHLFTEEFKEFFSRH